jgi:hypothetical protein
VLYDKCHIIAGDFLADWFMDAADSVRAEQFSFAKVYDAV